MIIITTPNSDHFCCKDYYSSNKEKTQNRGGKNTIAWSVQRIISRKGKSMNIVICTNVLEVKKCPSFNRLIIKMSLNMRVS